MNRDDDFDRTLEAWLHRQAPPQAPDRVLYAALERVDTESQRRGLLPRLSGGVHMTAILRAAAVTAVAAVALVVGLQLGNVAPGTGQGSPGPSAPASESPSPVPTVSPTRTPEPSSPLPVGCVNPPGDIADLMEAQAPGDPEPAACYGSVPITVEGQWVGAGAIGCPAAPEPAWLACSPFSLQLPGETRKVGAPSLWVALDPSVTTFPEAGVDVRVTGHFDDPAAQDCRNTSVMPDSSPEPDEVVAERCRQVFVITDIEELAG